MLTRVAPLLLQRSAEVGGQVEADRATGAAVAARASKGLLRHPAVEQRQRRCRGEYERCPGRHGGRKPPRNQRNGLDQDHCEQHPSPSPVVLLLPG